MACSRLPPVPTVCEAQGFRNVGLVHPASPVAEACQFHNRGPVTVQGSCPSHAASAEALAPTCGCAWAHAADQMREGHWGLSGQSRLRPLRVCRKVAIWKEQGGLETLSFLGWPHVAK